MFPVVPVGYGIAFLTLLLAAIVVAFVPKWQFLSAYFVGAALSTIPAFVLWIPCLICCGKLATIIDNRNLSLSGISLVFPLMLSTLAAAIASLVAGVFLSAKIVFKWRHDRIGP
jgi:hypothetical protein